ncbi:MAG: hypothetical protein QXD48_02305 [Candidatus Aenigmatarchaeota archaeon]
MKDKDRYFLILFILIVLFMIYSYVHKITGFSIMQYIHVSIKEKFEGKITGFVYRPQITIYETQNITAEFTNTGTKTFTAKIEEYIYFYQNGSLIPIATYFDNSVILNPGMKRSYKTVFIPPEVGIYYIKLRVSYETRIAELWGIFYVVYPSQPLPPQPVSAVGVGAGGIVISEPYIAGIPKLEIYCPNNIDLYQNQSILINITINNTGEIPVHNLRLYVSTTSFVNININPKQINRLSVNDTALFLISLNTSYPPPGQYTMDLEIITNEITLSKNIELNLLPTEKPIKEDIILKILNYKLLITEIENKILSAHMKGFDITLASNSLSLAKSKLEEAIKYYEKGDYENSRIELDIVKKYLEDSVFQLTHATAIFLYAKPPIEIYIFIITIILIASLILLYIFIKRRQTKKPKLLRAIETES